MLCNYQQPSATSTSLGSNIILTTFFPLKYTKQSNTETIANKPNAAHRDTGVLSCRTHNCFVQYAVDLAWPLKFDYRLEALQRILPFIC
jgi:hypothetical protein